MVSQPCILPETGVMSSDVHLLPRLYQSNNSEK